MMKKLSIISLLLSLCFHVFAQVSEVRFDESGKPLYMRIFDQSGVKRILFDGNSNDSVFTVDYNGQKMIIDSRFGECRRPESCGNQLDKQKVFEPAPLPEGDHIRKVGYTPDGRLLAVLFQFSNNVIFYDSKSYEKKAIINLGNKPMDMDLTNGKAYICCHESGEVFIIDLVSLSVSNVLKTGGNPCQVSVNPDETMLYIGLTKQETGMLAAYDIATLDEVFRTEEPNVYHYGNAGGPGRTSYSFTKFYLSPDGNRIIAARNGTYMPVIIDAGTGEIVKLYDFGYFRGSGFSTTGDTLFVYSILLPDKVMVHRIDMNSLSVIDSIVSLTTDASLIDCVDLVCNANGSKILAVGDTWNNRYCFFDFNTHQYQYFPSSHLMLIFPPVFATFDAKYAVVFNTNVADIIDLEFGNTVGTTPYSIHMGEPGAIIPNSYKMVSGDGPFYNYPDYYDEKIHVVDFEDISNIYVDTTIIAGVEPEADITNMAALSADGKKIIASNSLTHNVSIIDIESGATDTLVKSQNLTGMRIVPGKNLAILFGSACNYVRILDISTQSIIVEIYTDVVNNAIVSNDGQYAYLLDYYQGVYCRVTKLKIDGASSFIENQMVVSTNYCYFHQVFGEIDMYSTSVLSPDGNTLLFGGQDAHLGDVINVVDTRQMEVIASIPFTDGCIFGFAFTDDSQRAVALTFGSEVPVIYLDGENSYIENTFYIGSNSFSADYNPYDGLFYVLQQDNYIYRVEPETGHIVDKLNTDSNFGWKIKIDGQGNPLVLTSSKLIYKDECYLMPGISCEMSYDRDHDLFLIPVPGPDKVVTFGDLYVGISTPPGNIYEGGFSIMPNPANNQVLIKAEVSMNKIEIFDLTGERVFTQNIDSLNATLNISTMSQGIYFVKVLCYDRIMTQKLCITK